jgi:uncharacterized protein (TIGR02466 family)
VPEITPLFAVPFGFARVPEHAELNAELKQFYLSCEAAGEKFANPRPLTQRNRAVFESNFDLFRWQNPAVQRLKQHCWHHLTLLVAQLNRYDAAMTSRLLIYSDAWYHITRRGGFFALHNHPNASWSGVYCVDPGTSDPDKPHSGQLGFLSPATLSAMHLDAGNASLQAPFASGVTNLRLEAGQLVLFPSWVLHEVKPFEGEGERITIAFNCWFGLEDKPQAAP